MAVWADLSAGMAKVAQEVAQPRLGGGEFPLGHVSRLHELHWRRLATAEEAGDLLLQSARAGQRLVP